MFGKIQQIKLNILIISQYFWPENFRINQLSAALQKKGNKVTVLTGLPNYPEGKIYESYTKSPQNYNNYDGVDIIRVPLLPRGKNKFFLLLNYISFCISASTIGYSKIWNRNFDVIFVFQTSPVLVGIPSTLISFLKKTPQVIWILDLWPESLEALGILKYSWQKFLLRKLVNFIYFRCSYILCQSKSFIKEISKQNIDLNKLIFFPAWADTEIYKESNLYAPEVKTKKGFFNIIFTGNIGEAQDFPSIIKAFKILKERNIKNLRLIIIGEGRIKDWVRNEVELQNLSEIIEIYGKYPLQRMNSFFKHADALLVTLSNKKLFSMTIPGKIQTYLAAGIPIIGMINGEAANLLIEAKVGKVCDAGDYNNLADIIESFSRENKSILIRYGENGKKFCLRFFNKKNLINKLNILLLKTSKENKYK